jgi:hypothetical protein
MHNLPSEVLNQRYVKSAISCRKWAYATDYIRLWVLKQYGGFYMDLDVIAYKSFDPFLKHRFVSSLEFDPRNFYRTLGKNEVIGLGIEAAVMGSEPNHPFLQDILDYYSNLEFIDKSNYYINYLMPRVMTRVAVQKYGFKITPTYQILNEDIHIYPCDVFSSIYNPNILKYDTMTAALPHLGDSPIRYACHICAHSWWDGQYKHNLFWRIKHCIYVITGMKHWKSQKKW